MLPALDLLALGHNIPALHLQSVATIASVVGTAPVGARRWILTFPRSSKGAVDKAAERWRSLAAADTSWSRKLARYRPEERPSVESVETAAITLRKAGFGKAIATISGSIRAAGRVCEAIGMDPSPTELDAFAVHLRAVRAFEEDQNLAELLGPAWRGLGTPFEDVREGIGLRDIIHEFFAS